MFQIQNGSLAVTGGAIIGMRGVVGVDDEGTGVAGNGGVGVFGESDTGYGGSFTGGAAQLILVPSSAVGPRNSGRKVYHIELL
ncbi:MAG: hypothetical protein WBZ36_28745 [Candidatus Nitrosopolaris sp.]